MSAHEDCISALPDHILHQILSLLPMKVAVQTSILSSRWRNLWKYVSVVDFNFSSGESIDYVSITRCLQCHRAPNITEFSMVIDDGDCFRRYVRQWVSFALMKQVKVLKINPRDKLPSDIKLVAMPDLLYKKDRIHLLEKISLSSVEFTPRRSLGFSGFIALKMLSLTYCKVSEEALEVVVSKCLALEVLIICFCEGLGNIKISGPNLRLKEFAFRFGQVTMLEVVNVPSLQHLQYSGDLSKIHLTNLPNLSQVTLVSLDDKFDEENIGHLRALANEVVQVFVLNVNSWFLEFISNEYRTRDCQYAAFPNLRDFEWYVELKSECDVLNLVAFLGNCPSLESAQIVFSKSFWQELSYMLSGGEPDFVTTEGVGDEINGACLERLKFIEVKRFSGFKGEMELLKRLLEKAVALESMNVHWRAFPRVVSHNESEVVNHVDKETVRKQRREWIEKQVYHFSKASSHSQVVFKQNDGT